MLCAKLGGKSGRLTWLDQCGACPLGKAASTGKDKQIVTNSYESLLFQHKTKPLTYTVWGDNNFVRTLSNFHIIGLIKGMGQKLGMIHQLNCICSFLLNPLLH